MGPGRKSGAAGLPGGEVTLGGGRGRGMEGLGGWERGAIGLGRRGGGGEGVREGGRGRKYSDSQVWQNLPEECALSEATIMKLPHPSITLQ